MLQLKKSIRLRCLNQPFKKAIVTAAEIGADAIELSGHTHVRPAEMGRTAVRHLRKMLSDLNLTVSAIHFPTRRGYGNTDDLDERIDATKKTISMAYDLGCQLVVNRIGAISDDVQSVERQTMVQALTDIGNHSQRAGAWLAATTGSESDETLRGLIDSLPAMSIVVDFDPGDLLINGFSADDSIRHLGENVMNFRVRDAVRDLAMGRGLEVQLGRGSIDWASLLSVLEEKNYKGYLAVDRTAESDPVVECGQAIEYLTNMFR